MFGSIADLAEAALVARRVDQERRRSGPLGILAPLRRRGLTRQARGPAARTRLQRVIRFVDRWFASGPNCYRRALIETAMDAGAAAENLCMGINASGDQGSGHAWLELSADRGPGYEAEFRV